MNHNELRPLIRLGLSKPVLIWPRILMSKLQKNKTPLEYTKRVDPQSWLPLSVRFHEEFCSGILWGSAPMHEHYFSTLRLQVGRPKVYYSEEEYLGQVPQSIKAHFALE